MFILVVVLSVSYCAVTVCEAMCLHKGHIGNLSVCVSEITSRADWSQVRDWAPQCCSIWKLWCFGASQCYCCQRVSEQINIWWGKDKELYPTRHWVTQSDTTCHHLGTKSHSAGFSCPQQDSSSLQHSGESSTVSAQSDTSSFHLTESNSGVPAASECHSTGLSSRKQDGKVTRAVWVAQAAAGAVSIICTGQRQGAHRPTGQHCTVGALSTVTGVVGFQKETTDWCIR